MHTWVLACLLVLGAGGVVQAQTAPQNAASEAVAVQSTGPNLAGVVTLAEGNATLAQAGGAARVAKVGDTISEGDVLTTSKDGELHMVMQDTGFVALRPNSRLVVVHYKADGGDDDKGVFSLLTGGLRSITGWIGRFNTRAYQVRTPTATIGIRGTDHETRYIPEGSSEGEPGTYDKVYAGQTFIETADGGTEVAPDQAGFVSLKPKDRPRLLARVPGFFRPGPHEVEIAKKHAEIQGLIDQRRNERRKVIAEKLAALLAARQHLRADIAQAKAAMQHASPGAQLERKALTEQREALLKDAHLLKQRADRLKTQRGELQALVQAGQISGPDLRRRRKALMDESAALERAQDDLESRRKALQESLESKLNTLLQGDEALKQSLHQELMELREKRRDLEAERASARQEIGTLQRQENQRLRGELQAERMRRGAAGAAEAPK